MGGYGSGRWGWHRAKTDTDGLLRLDVRWLARQGLIAPGVVGALAVAWSRGEPGIFSVPRKPEGMHWRTYELIAAEIRAREHAATVACGAETDALVARFERKYGPLPSECPSSVGTTVARAVVAQNGRSYRPVGGPRPSARPR